MPIDRIAVPFDVVLDDGRTVKVVADQRDYAALEAAECDSPALQVGKSHTRARFLGWSAMRRGGHYSGTFDAFNERDALDVQVTDESDSEGGQGVDPGPAPAGAGN